MSDVIIFGGTTEGRRLAEFCGEHKIQTVVCVVSEYGEMLVPESPSVRVIRRALEKDEMEALFVAEKPSLVLDATHPYARGGHGKCDAGVPEDGDCVVPGFEKIRTGNEKCRFHSDRRFRRSGGRMVKKP